MESSGVKTQEGFQRRTILIKKSLQYRYMALILISVLIGFMIVGLEVSWTLSRILAEHPMLQPLLEHLTGMLPLFLMKTGIYLGIVLIVSSVISHRMAGPVYKFEKSAGIVASGDLTHRVFLRKGDQLTELQDEFNRMVADIQSKVKNDRKAAGTAAARLEEIAGKSSDVEIKKELLAVKEKLAAITKDFTV